MESWDGGKAGVEPMYPAEQCGVSKSFTNDELWAFLGLAEHSRNDVSRLMRARAWAKLADLHPASGKAVQLIDRHLLELEGTAREQRRKERKAVMRAYEKYSEGMNSLEDLIGDLQDISGDWED